MTEIELKISDDPVPKEIMDTAVSILAEHTTKSGGSQPASKPFSVLAYIGPDLVGGLIGTVFYNWLYANIVWIRDDLRDQDIGTAVMQAAEQRARKMELSGIHFWTQTWQAPGFYKTLGYAQFAELKNCPPGHSRLGFFKYLQ